MKYDRTALLRRHPQMLARLNYRCQLSGQVADKSIQRKYRNYNFHHTAHSAYGHERVGYNYLLLKPWAHALVHLLGGVLPWEMSKGAVRLQDRRAKHLPLTALWAYPNLLQRGFHTWCRVPMIVKDLARWVVEGCEIAAGIVGVVAGVVYFVVRTGA